MTNPNQPRWVNVTRLSSISMYALVLFCSLVFWRCSPEPGTTDGGEGCVTAGDCKELDERCKDGKCSCRNKKCVPRNAPPVAEAGQDQEVNLKEEVFLDGGGSFDPDVDTLSFSWTFTSKPDGSAATINKANEIKASFSPDVAGTYVIQLEVNDGTATGTDTVTITVKKGPNTAPKAKVGDDRSVELNKEVTLDGSGSSDPDGDKLTFTWELTVPTGSSATLSDTAAEKPTFTTDVEGEYVAKLTVSDGEESDTASVTITAVKDINKQPKIDKLDPTRVPTGAFASVKITGSNFSQGAVVLFQNREVSTKSSTDTELVVDLNLTTVVVGKYPLKVKNSNGQQSNEVELEVFEVPSPVISTLTPDKAGAGAIFTMKVSGQNFVNGAKVFFTGTELKTTFVSGTEVEATVDLTGISTGIYPILLRNPGGKDSNTVNFEVTIPPPPPEISIINPEESKAGAPIDFTVFGKRFNQGSQILFDGKPIPTKYVGVGELQADPKLDLTNVTGGVKTVQVQDNQGYKSTVVNFTVLDQFPTPSLTSVSPNSGSTQSITKVTLTGKFFDANATVILDGSPAKTTTYVSSTQLQAELDLQNIQPSSVTIWVENPAPPGQTQKRKSNTLAFTVKPLPAPSITSVKGSYLYKGKQGTIEVTGQGFTPTTIFQFSTRGTRSTSTSYCRSTYIPTTAFADQKTTFISSTTLRATFVMPTSGTTSSNSYFAVRIKRGTQFSNYMCIYVSYSTSNPPVPVLTVLNPVAVNSGTTSPVKVTLSGSSFDPFVKVFFNKKLVTTTTYRSSGSLESLFPITGLAEGAYDVQVENSSGDKSGVLKFSILKQGQPLLQTISPTSIYAGNSYTLTLTGQGFDPKSTVEADGKPITGTATYSSATRMTVSSAIFKYNPNKSVAITVSNPSGLKSNPVALGLLFYAAPNVTSISPTSFEEGSTVSQVTVYGSNFRSGTSYFVLSNGKKTTCTYSATSRLYCQNIDFAGLKQGTNTFQIENPDGQLSNKQNFTISKPVAPTVSSITPTTAFNNQIVTLTINGTRLGKSTLLVFGTKTYPVTYVSTSRVTAKVDLNGMQQGIVQVKVRNSIAGTNYDSNGSNFIVLEPPVPVVKYFQPMTGPMGAKQTITITGEDYNAGSKVFLNSVEQTVKSRTTTTLSVELDLVTLKKGSYTLQVDNGGGKKSAVVYFNVVDPPGPTVREVRPAGVIQSLTNSTITVYGTNFDPKAVVTLKGTTVGVSSITSTQIQFSVPFPKQLYPANSKIEVRVTNPNGQSAAGYVYVMDTSAPIIQYINPLEAFINDSITLDIYGSGFSGVTLFVDGQTKTYSYRTSYIRVSGFNVGNQARNIEIKVQRGSAFSNPYFFKVNPLRAPVITYLEPSYGKRNTTVNLKIQGSYFQTSPASTVRIDGKDYVVNSSGSSSSVLSVSVPLTGVTAGPKALQVRNPDLQFSQTVYFHVTP
ncbi:MAG: hypothetical protein EP343_14385 [Deltaproteobacteria bacterium]|nr:MAG: hypothetical protein EP343_14385 [Deltaproteobacteria bacterium]